MFLTTVTFNGLVLCQYLPCDSPVNCRHHGSVHPFYAQVRSSDCSRGTQAFVLRAVQSDREEQPSSLCPAGRPGLPRIFFY